MTDAQWKVRTEQISAELHYDERAFRKKCVTQGIVTIKREGGSKLFTVRYRDSYVCTLFNDHDDERILMAVWNTIEYAEETIKKIEGVKHESK